MTFKVPEVDWAAVEYPIEGKTKGDIRIQLLHYAPSCKAVFGQSNGRIDGTSDIWYPCIWDEEGREYSGEGDASYDLELRTFGKLPRKN